MCSALRIMSSDNLPPDRAAATPFVKPFLRALDQMRERETLRPEQLLARAEALMADRFGPSQEAPVQAFAYGNLGLVAAHTLFFDGFALLLPINKGVAVAIRRSPAPAQVVFEGGGVQSLDATASEGGGVVQALVEALVPPETSLQIAVVEIVGERCTDAYLSALAIAMMRACQHLFGGDPKTLLRTVQGALGAFLDRPFGIASLIASDVGKPDSFVLVDTATLEHLALEGPGAATLGWGLIHLGTPPQTPDFYRGRQQKVAKAMAILQNKGFPGPTLRAIEHRDLDRTLEALSRSLRPIVRHLVTENRRVQKLVVAVRRRDWQMFGALLLMSYASGKNDWHSPAAPVDQAIQAVEALSLDGMYGAITVCSGRSVLVVGQPFVVPTGLQQVQEATRQTLGQAPDTLLL